MKDIVVKIENLTKIYKLYEKQSDRLKESLGLTKKKKHREHYALRDINFEIERGEAVGIIGTNGSGKSTILKIITGVLNPTMGNVTVDGRISALLELGAGFNMEYTGIENVYLNGTMIGFSEKEIEDKMESILEFADIGDFVYQPVKTYSSGMFVRLAFAVAINIEPEILIVDEALSVGDVFFQTKCYQKFEEFKNQGKTILFVSHDMSSIVKYCDRVIVLNQGKFVADGDPGEMVNLYKKILVSQYNPEAETEEVLEERIAAKMTGEATEQNNQGDWKSSLQINKNVDIYGNGKAKILDFAILDEGGIITNTIMKGTTFIIKQKIEILEDIENPIFTFTIKDKQGLDITGTNTMFENKQVGMAKAGDVYTVSFRQEARIQNGEYLLSISCTGFENGEFIVYDRAYDVTFINIVSDKNAVGVVDPYSEVNIEKE